MYRKITICVFTAIGVLMACYIILVTVPKLLRLPELNSQIESRMRIAAVRDRNLENIEDNRVAVQEFLAEHAVLENIIVPKPKMILAILEAGDMFDEYSLDELSFRMTDTISVENLLSRNYSTAYNQASAEFSVVGTAANITEFLNAWKQSDIKYMVDGLTVSREGIDSGNVKLTMKYSIFFSE